MIGTNELDLYISNKMPPTRLVLLALTYRFAVYSFAVCLVRDKNNKDPFQICFSTMVAIILSIYT
jgi:hypothetical protein